MQHVYRAFVLGTLVIAMGAARASALVEKTIYDLQQDLFTVGDSCLEDSVVVIGVDTRPSTFGVYIQEPGGGPYSGILAYRDGVFPAYNNSSDPVAVEPAMHRVIGFGVLLIAVGLAPANADEIVRRPRPAISRSRAAYACTPGTELLFLSGTLADVANADAPAGSVERLGDTETQAASVLGKLAKELEASGLTFADVVKMNVFLVGNPRLQNTMDFQGLMNGYLQFFGTDSQKNLPARTTVQVAGLPVPGALVEIEVVAARHGDH